jgi:glycosyltransferase involved in cell wall biosynthesis
MSELEALAAPLPVVRTPVSGPSEVVIDEGNRLLLPLRAAEPFTDAVLRLLEHEPPRPVLAAPPLSECRWNHAIERYAPLTAEWQLAERHRTLAEEPGQLSTVGG